MSRRRNRLAPPLLQHHAADHTRDIVTYDRFAYDTPEFHERDIFLHTKHDIPILTATSAKCLTKPFCRWKNSESEG